MDHEQLNEKSKIEVKPLKADLIVKFHQAIKDNSEAPSVGIRALGNSFIKIADALEGMDGKDAILTLKVVAMMEGIEL